MVIKIEIGNIVDYDCDAIVNAANFGLRPGGGVCGAIFSAAGYEELKKECAKIGFCEVGHSVITDAYNLKAKYIIHTVGPVYKGIESKELLEKAYKSTLDLADSMKLKSIAIPSISTGIYGYPKEEAAEIAIKTVCDYNASFLETVVLVCYDFDTLLLYTKKYEEKDIDDFFKL